MKPFLRCWVWRRDGWWCEELRGSESGREGCNGYQVVMGIEMVIEMITLIKMQVLIIVGSRWTPLWCLARLELEIFGYLRKCPNIWIFKCLDPWIYFLRILRTQISQTKWCLVRSEPKIFGFLHFKILGFICLGQIWKA